MLHLSEKNALLTSVNPRSEIHGDEKKPAVDLHFSIDTTVDMLGGLSPMLPASLFQRDDAPVVDLATDREALSKYKFANRIEAVSWKLPKPARCRVVVHFGVSGQQDIVLGEALVDKIRIEPHDGGTVTIGFRVQTTEPTAEQKGRLCEWIQQAVDITVEPLPEPAQEDMVGDDKPKGTAAPTPPAEKSDKPKKPTAAEKKAAREAAEAAFTQQFEGTASEGQGEEQAEETFEAS
jgi:hypothetical protein